MRHFNVDYCSCESQQQNWVFWSLTFPISMLKVIAVNPLPRIQLFHWLRLSTSKAEKSNYTSAKGCWESLWKFINLLAIPAAVFRARIRLVSALLVDNLNWNIAVYGPVYFRPIIDWFSRNMTKPVTGKTKTWIPRKLIILIFYAEGGKHKRDRAR
jgi:hypothetical protein